MTVYVVHCIDTEGPLYESLEATFERLNDIFGLDFEPSEDLLKKLQQGRIDLEVDEEAVQNVLDPELLDYNDNWEQLDRMLDDALSDSFRNQYTDSKGSGWIYNWFTVDHVDYEVNPRRRSMGHHQIFDHYRKKLEETDSPGDGIHFHHHPHPIKRHAHRNATHWWVNSDALYQTLSRRIIDRDWFPAANRPGFHAIRPDSHWFLEQYIPFDFANQAKESMGEVEDQFDFANGRTGDWRRAPQTWEPYHPSHDDYQARGECRRWIARCLNIGSRYLQLTEADVRQAFREAKDGKDVVLSFSNHDYRDIRPNVAETHDLLSSVSAEFPDIDFEYCDAVEAMQNTLQTDESDPCDLELTLTQPKSDAHVLTVETDVPSFGPQPYLAFKTVTADYYHDNFDFQEPNHKWTYVFDDESFQIDAIETIGVAVNNRIGETTVATYDVETDSTTKTYWNLNQ